MFIHRPVRALAAAVAGLLIAGGAMAQDPSPTLVPPVPRGDEVIAEGRALPVRAAVLGVESPGVVVSVAPLGAQVAEGDPLIVLDPAAETAQVAQAEAGLDAATAALAQAQAAADQAAAAADAATAGVARATAELDVARHGVTRSQAGLDEAEAARDALPDTASSALERQAKAVVQGAQAGLEQARSSRTAAEAVLAQTEAEAARAAAARDAAESAVAVAEAEVARAQAALSGAQGVLARRTVTAPFAGTVAASILAPGEYATPGLPIMRLGDPTGWIFETTDLGTAGAARIMPGDTATITVDDIDGLAIPAVVREVALYGDERQGDIAFRAIVDPVGPVPAAVRWNTIVTITILPGTATSAP